MLPARHLVLVLIALTSCAPIERADNAAAAKAQMVGMSREQVLTCMGPAKKKANESSTEVWSYISTNGRGDYNGDTVKGSSFAVTSASHDRSFCTVNIVMKDGVVTAVHYNGPTSSYFYAKDDQCGFAVANCVKRTGE